MRAVSPRSRGPAKAGGPGQWLDRRCAMRYTVCRRFTAPPESSRLALQRALQRPLHPVSIAAHTRQAQILSLLHPFDSACSPVVPCTAQSVLSPG